jgi:carnitine-CoA ligase
VTTTLPAPDTCVSRYVLERHAREKPDQIFAVFETGGSWTYGETLSRTRKVAATLQELGVAQDDHVVVWLPNNAEALETYLAINYIGAVYIPINTGYVGGLLAHVIENCDAKLIIAHHELAPRLTEIETSRLETVLVSRGACTPIKGLRLLDYDDALPKTPTTKVQKASLRDTGVTEDTWDREAAGIRLRGAKLA